MQSIFLGYLQANLNQSLKLPGIQFMGFKPMPKICVFQSIRYTAHMVYNRENLQKYHTLAPKKNTEINSKGFTSSDGDTMIQWRRSFEVHESFAKTIGRHI
jgi:hypothetical protein